ncbi:MAG: LPS export ABC transporter periplasmic protein LptC, partial [Tannerella sp.]|nr:LPS export ABC transporter periplasmic protein LptC [Tannerella sp.]
MAIALIAVVMFLNVFFSCSGDKKDTIEVSFDPQTSYTLKETGVNTYMSDSGITRYKVITATYLMYGKASEPYWYFPDGIYLEKFDTLMRKEATIQADTARYFERRKLWQLDGNVDIWRLEGNADAPTDSTHFETEQLFWDQNTEKVYSDSFIRITKGENLNYGIGFSSNQDMSEYRIFHPGALFYINTQRRDSVADASSEPFDRIKN